MTDLRSKIKRWVGRFSVGEKAGRGKDASTGARRKRFRRTYHAGSEQAFRFRGKALDARASALQPTRTFGDEFPGRPGPCSQTEVGR